MTKTDFLKKQFGFVFLPDLTEKAEFTFYELHTLLEDYEKAINYSQCCKSDSEQLTCDNCKHNCLVWNDDHPCATCAEMDNYVAR